MCAHVRERDFKNLKLVVLKNAILNKTCHKYRIGIVKAICVIIAFL